MPRAGGASRTRGPSHELGRSSGAPRVRTTTQEDAATHRGGLLPLLTSRCQTLRTAVLVRQHATADEVAGYWPGGAENPGKKVFNWVVCYANLVGFLRRAEGREGTGGSRVADPATDALHLAALRGAPESVTLTTPEADGSPRVVTVHPKSVDAILALAARDVTITYLRHHLAALRSETERVEVVPDPAALALVPRVLAELGYQQKLACWIVTTPGAWLPVDLAREPRPVLPEWLDALTPLDVVLILRTHGTVNAGNVHALTELIDAEDDETGRSSARASWGLFLGSAAVALNVRAEDLLRDWSLAAILASHRAHARTTRDSYRDAEERAKANAGTNHGGRT